MVELKNYVAMSQEYELNLPNSIKKSNGIFYTDLWLAQMMINEININIKNASLIDPTCGTGAFIISAYLKGYSNIYGMDIDSGAISILKKHCPFAKVVQYDSLFNSSTKIIEVFGLYDKFDVVIGNPPYAQIPKDLTEKIDDYLFLRNIKLSGNNLYIAALLRAIELVKDSGIISYIIPKNFLHVSSYSLLRREILRDFSIISIVDIGSYFKNVRGEQVILTIKKQKNRGNQVTIKKLVDSTFKIMATICQDFYTDEIILFDCNEDFTLYKKFKEECYTTLKDYSDGYIGRGRSKSPDAISGKDIRKFGLKNNKKFGEGNQIFIQNIYSSESGIIACYGGNGEASETVTVFTDGDIKMCKYVLGILHSRLCNFYLYKYCYNNSKLTMHVDSKYIKKIPFIVNQKYFDTIVDYVSKLENEEYMSEKWFHYYELLNREVYNIYNIDNEEMEYIENQMRRIQSRKWASE